ncbi:FecR family protein [Muricauda sp. 334s03]|uniref:FecR family protein n=1 Tax=Flagellimonas yonaguniensis TaxID=3031325 RepID=A0ABT5XVZ6_9FLAO|nr:FecR family protein [[Muricauda] yonaguniensis]MDF0715315.1 FecR family protein [[Muricauda] yonaguniensis]
MDKEQFLHLIEKHLSGKTTHEEEKILLRYYNSFQKNDGEEVEGSLGSDDQKKVILDNIHKEMDKEDKRRLWTKEILKYAAIGILLLGSGYFFKTIFIRTGSNVPLGPRENSITLEMENGSTKLISEGATINIKNTEGNIIANQNGNQLVYDNEADSEELVYNTLRVPYGKKFNLLLSDGTKARLNSGSSLKYPVKFLQGMKRRVFLTGEVFLEVQKDSAHPFIVNADNLNIQVLGTKFNVNAYPEDETADVVLVEGSVQLRGATHGLGSILLKPGFKGSYNKKTHDFDTREVLTGIYTSWMEGDLVFRNMTFQNILKKLERHYAVVIINNNNKLSLEKFNASFTNEPLIKVLENLKATYGIEFEIDKNQITIY